MTNERDDHIRRRAHEIWEREGRPQGRHDDHWAQAAREIEAEAGKASTSGPAKPRTRKAADGAATATRATKPKPAAVGTDAAAAAPRRRAAKPAAEGAAKPARAPRKPAKSATAET